MTKSKGSNGPLSIMFLVTVSWLSKAQQAIRDEFDTLTNRRVRANGFPKGLLGQLSALPAATAMLVLGCTCVAASVAGMEGGSSTPAVMTPQIHKSLPKLARRVHKDILITKKVDKSSPTLNSAKPKNQFIKRHIGPPKYED
jgi:hypothetical protein